MLIDEADCIGACIDHRLTIGFDHVVVTDLGGTDGSREIVESRLASGRVTILPGSQALDSDWHAKMLELAVDHLQADFVAHIDPDEFWIPTSGNCQTLEGLGSTDVFSVTRFNAVQVASEVTKGRVLRPRSFMEQIVYVERPVLGRDAPMLTGLYQARVGPKVMHRAVNAKIAAGAHFVTSEALTVTRVPKDVVILHFPLSSYDHFDRKLANAADFLNANPKLPKKSAWHWRRFVEAKAQGRLPEEYAAQFLPAKCLQEAVATGRFLPLFAVLEELKGRYYDYSRPPQSKIESQDARS